jgi:hypothetical protein
MSWRCFARSTTAWLVLTYAAYQQVGTLGCGSTGHSVTPALADRNVPRSVCAVMTAHTNQYCWPPPIALTAVTRNGSANGCSSMSSHGRGMSTPMLSIRCTTRLLTPTLGAPCLDAGPANRGLAALHRSGHMPRPPAPTALHRHLTRPIPDATGRAQTPAPHSRTPPTTRTRPATRKPGAPCPWPDT